MCIPLNSRNVGASLTGMFMRPSARSSTVTADELGSGVRRLMKYGKAYGGGDPELVEGDVFGSIV